MERLSLRARLWTLIALIGAAAVYVHFLSDVRPVPLRSPLSGVPLAIGEWTGRTFTMEDAIVENAGVEDYLLREYTDPSGFGVNAYVGYYEMQREGDTAHSPQHCLPGSGWSPIQSDVISFATPGFNGGTTRAFRYLIAKGDERQLVLYWYQGRGRNVTNEYAAKVYLVVDSIFRKRNDGSLIRFMAPVAPSVEPARAQERITALARVFLPIIGGILPE